MRLTDVAFWRNVAHLLGGTFGATQPKQLATFLDPDCVKSPKAPKSGEWLSGIAQNRPRSEIVITLIMIRGEIFSINFPRRSVSTQPRPKAALYRHPLQTLAVEGFDTDDCLQNPTRCDVDFFARL
jgi:hypothetical protein